MLKSSPDSKLAHCGALTAGLGLLGDYIQIVKHKDLLLFVGCFLGKAIL